MGQIQHQVKIRAEGSENTLNNFIRLSLYLWREGMGLGKQVQRYGSKNIIINT